MRGGDRETGVDGCFTGKELHTVCGEGGVERECECTCVRVSARETKRES